MDHVEFAEGASFYIDRIVHRPEDNVVCEMLVNISHSIIFLDVEILGLTDLKMGLYN